MLRRIPAATSDDELGKLASVLNFTFSRLYIGQERMKHEPLDLAHIAGDAIDRVQTLADARGITLDLQLGKAVCMGDEQRLGQVLINLLSDAVEHAKHRVVLSTRIEEGKVLVSVSDDGEGIAEAHLPHHFQQFYRADQARSRGSEHNGLGLAISKAIVEAHGGSMSLRSTPLNGCTFVMSLPIP